MCPWQSALELNAPALQVANEAGRRRRRQVVEEARGGIGERGVVVGPIKSEL